MTTSGTQRAQLPSVAQVLQFGSLAAADPVVVGGAAGLGRPVRWVHVSELADIAGHLRGQEMILTTGIALPGDDAGLRRYIAALAEVDIAAVVVGMGPHFDRTLPVAMMEAADEHSIPLVVLRRHAAFVDITEDVHARLVDAQVEQLQQAVQIHETLRTLVIQGSTVKDILVETARLSGRAVVLEDLRQELLDVAEGPRSRGDVTTEWAEHTRRHRVMRRTDYDPRTGWLTTTVGIKGDDWGRLIIMGAADATLPRGLHEDPLSLVQPTLIMLIERAASTVALGRLVEGDRGALGSQTHLGILEGMMAGGRAAEEAEGLAEAVGFSLPTAGVVALAAVLADPDTLTLRAQQDLLHAVGAAMRGRCVRLSIPFLLAQTHPDGMLMLAAVGDFASDPKALEVLEEVMRVGQGQLVLGIARPSNDPLNPGGLLREARETAEIARALGITSRPVTRSDLGLEGLLLSMAADERVLRFSDETLAVLRQQDPQLIDALRSYLFAGRNKSLAAKRSFVSRQWLYEQLDRAERLLGISLDDESVCLKLQVAILIADLSTQDKDGGAPNAGGHRTRTKTNHTKQGTEQ